MAETLASNQVKPVSTTDTLRKPSRRQKVFLAVLLLLLFAFPLLQFVVGGLNYWLHMLLFTFMYIAMASSWNIIGGYAGYTSLGHNVFFAVGGYFTGVLLVYFDISPFLTAPLAGLVSMGLGLLVGLISLRTRGPAFIISTTVASLTTRGIMVMLMGLFAWLAINAPYWNWYRFPADFTIGQGLDRMIGWLLGGFLIAWMIQRAEKKAAV